MATQIKDDRCELNEIRQTLAPETSKWLRAYMECSDEVQEVVREMVKIIDDTEVDDDDRELAIATLVEALFPASHNGVPGADIEELEEEQAARDKTTKQVVEELDAEEATFSNNVRRFMEVRGITQEQLAAETGLGQPAISMMLKRQARPQRKTVEKFAKALGVEPVDLWPSW